MPHSSTANYTCDVIKVGGNDDSHAGPFKTIQAAISYLTNNPDFTLSADNKGVIYIAPGIYNEAGDAIGIGNDGARYIDFVGAGKDATIIRSASNHPLYIAAAGAYNHFSNLNIEYNGAGASDCAVDIQYAHDVLMENCRIKSTTGAIAFLAQNAELLNCEIESESTASNTSVNGAIEGTVRNSIFFAPLLGVNSSMIDGVTGWMINCRINTISNLGTPVQMKAIAKVNGGRLTNCVFECQSFCIMRFESEAILESCILATEGTGDVGLMGEMADGTIRKCFFHQKVNAPVIGRGAIDAGVLYVFDSTFYAPLGNQNIIGSIEYDGSHWENCLLISSNNATAGYSLTSNGGKRIATIKNIVSNRPLDPRLILTDNGLESKTIGEAKGYNQKRWAAVNCYCGYVNSIGVFTTTLGYLSSANESAGSATKFQTDNITGATAGLSSSEPTQAYEVYNFFRREHNPIFYIKFRLGYYTDINMWCGIVANTPANNTDIGTQAAALRYFSGTDTNFMYVTHNSTNQLPAPVDSGVPGNTEVHTLKITINDQLGVAVFEMDGDPATASVISIYLPDSGTEVGIAMRIFTTSNNERHVFIYNVWCEYNA